MKLLYKYYRWRAKHAKTQEKVEHFRLMAYYCSQTYRKRKFIGRDLTDAPDAAEIKRSKVKDGPKLLHGADHVFSSRSHYAPGRYWTGEKNKGAMDFREIPQRWAEHKIPNEQHMPTFNLKAEQGIRWEIDEATGRRQYFRYNYKTGKQEKID